MKLKGKDLIKWIKDNDLEDKEVFTNSREDMIVAIKEESLIIDECGDILIYGSK